MGNKGSKLLYQAARDGKLEEAKDLLFKGTGTEYKDGDGRTALMIASYNGHHDVVRNLLEYKFDINAKSEEGVTALIWASAKGRLECVRTLLEYGSEVNTKTNPGNTALIVASKFGHEEIVRTLLEYGADVNVKDKDGQDALYWACSYQKWDVAELLLLNGADADVTNKKCDSARKYINWHNKQEMLTRVQRALAAPSSSSSTSYAKVISPAVKKQSPPTLTSNSAVSVPAAVKSPEVNTPLTSKREESEAMIESLTSRLSLSLSLNQQLKNQLQGSEATIATLTSQLNKSSRESYDKLSEVEKRNKLLSGDHDALSNISLEQCDELILTLSRSQEKLQQRKSFLVSERNLCVICQDAQKNILLRPCNHLCLCGNCASNIVAVTRCPLCNTTINERIPVFA